MEGWSRGSDRPGARRPARSVEELVAGASRREDLRTEDARSGSLFERVEIDGRRFVLKVMHVDDDWISRMLGDLGSWTLRAWTSGVLDAFPPFVSHTVVGAAGGLGRNGWGTAVLMEDVGDHLVPPGDDVVALELHASFIDHMAALAVHFRGWQDTVGLMPPVARWSFFTDEALAIEAAAGWPNPVPAIADRGWRAFDERVPPDIAGLVRSLRGAPWELAARAMDSPTTLLHGDWKMGNLGALPDGRTILLDCTYIGAGPIVHDLCWYLALNTDRLPEAKEAAIDRFRRGLERRGLDTSGWWDRQLDLCLLGAVVQFGWEKALGPDPELAWWVDRVRRARGWL